MWHLVVRVAPTLAYTDLGLPKFDRDWEMRVDFWSFLREIPKDE